MRYSVGNFVRILGALATLTLFAAPLKADPIVLITPGGTGATNINSTQPFIVGTTDAAGSLTAVFRNDTNMTFVAFRFFQNLGVQTVPLQGFAMPIFSEVQANNFSIDFLQGHQGTGLPPKCNLHRYVYRFPARYNDFRHRNSSRASYVTPPRHRRGWSSAQGTEEIQR